MLLLSDNNIPCIILLLKVCQDVLQSYVHYCTETGVPFCIISITDYSTNSDFVRKSYRIILDQVGL